MRNYKLIILTIILFLNFKFVLATGQAGELIIFQGDTLEMLSLPLESYLNLNEPREKYNPYLEYGCSTGNYRGYVGLWEISDNKLLLKSVFVCGEKSNDIKNVIFKNRQGDIFADWFTGELSIQKGKLIKYYHSFFERWYEKEIVLKIENGKVIGIQEFDNGIRPNDNNFPLDDEKIISKIYEGINWKNLPLLSNKLKIYLDIKINEKGELEYQGIHGEIENIYNTELKRAINGFPRIQIFYSRDEPMIQNWSVQIIFSRKNYRKYAR